MSHEMKTRYCPDCGGHDIEDNGEADDHPDLTLLCMGCGNQWDPNDGEAK